MNHESFVSLTNKFINPLFILFGSKGNRAETHSLSPSEERRPMNPWKNTNLTDYWSKVLEASTINPLPFLQNHLPHSLVPVIVNYLSYQRSFLLLKLFLFLLHYRFVKLFSFKFSRYCK